MMILIRRIFSSLEAENAHFTKLTALLAVDSVPVVASTLGEEIRKSRQRHQLIDVTRFPALSIAINSVAGNC